MISAQQRTARIWANVIRYYMNVSYTVTMHDPWRRAMFKCIYGKIFASVVVVSGRGNRESIAARLNKSEKIAEYIKERLSLENMAKAYLNVFEAMK